MSGHVVLAFGPNEAAYVRGLIEHFSRADIPVWTYEGGESEDEWVQVLRPRIDTCAAFVPVVTPAALSSGLFQRQVARAFEMGKPVLPLLLDGVPYGQLAIVPGEDVRGGRLPSDAYLARLGEVLGRPAPIEREARSAGWRHNSGPVAGVMALLALTAAVLLYLPMVETFDVYPPAVWTWLPNLSGPVASIIAAVAVYRFRTWMFPATVAVIVSASAIFQRILTEADLIRVGEFWYLLWLVPQSLLLLGALARNRGRASTFVVRPLRRIARIATLALVIYAVITYGVYFPYWNFIIHDLAALVMTYLPCVVLLFQASWENQRRARVVGMLAASAYSALGLAPMLRPTMDITATNTTFIVLRVALLACALVALLLHRREPQWP